MTDGEFENCQPKDSGKFEKNQSKPVRCGCGGEAEILHSYKKYAFVYCKQCETMTTDFPTEAEVIEAWNRAMGGNVQIEGANVPERIARVAVVEKPNVYKCSECGQYFHQTAWGSPVVYCSRCGARLEWG